MKIIKKPESINVTTVGNPSISDDYIVSDFSTSSYVSLSNMNIDTTQSWEINLCFTTKTNISTRQKVLGANVDHKFATVWFRYNKLYGEIPSTDGSSWDIASENTAYYTISTNTKYYVKMTFDGNNEYEFLVSTDNNNWTTIWTVTSTKKMYNPNNYTIWLGQDSITSLYLRGDIDLKECYIKSNNNIVWQGVEMKYYAPRKLAPNVISIGTTSINDDLIYSKSDGTTSSYIYQNIDLSNYDYTTDDIEIVTKTRYSAGQTQGSIYVCSNFGSNVNNFRFSTFKTGTYNDTSGIAGSIAGNGFVINYSTVKNQMYSYDWFYEKVTFDHSTHKIEVWTSLDKINWTSIGSYIQDSWLNCIKEINKIVFGVCYNNNNATESAFSGDIDLKECYIKVNNNIIWSGMQYSNLKLYGIMPYIESDGNGQYIDLSPIYSTPQNDDIITFTAQTPDYKTVITPTDDYYYGYVVDDNSGGMNSVCLFRKYVKTNSYGTQVFGVYWTFGTSSSSSGDTDNGEYGGIYKFTYSHSLGYTGWWGSNHKLKVFNQDNKFTVRVWNVNMVRNNQKIFDLYATEQNGIVGMKDIISGTFLPNSGTGTLVLKY